MTGLVQRQSHFLKLINQTSPAQRKAILQTVTRDQVKVLSQIAYNVLRSTIKLTSSQAVRFKKQRRFVYVLANKKVGYGQKCAEIQRHTNIVYTLVKLATDYLSSVLQ